jgi:hypothetical protein
VGAYLYTGFSSGRLFFKKEAEAGGYRVFFFTASSSAHKDA